MNNIYLPFTNSKDLKLAFIFQDFIQSHQQDLITGPSVIKGVYGTFPRAIWNGGRTIEIDKPKYSKNKIEEKIALINSKNLQCRMTFTNNLLEKEHLDDDYCNLILTLLDNGNNNAVIVNSPILEEYIKYNYPNLLLVSSITKGNDFQTFKTALWSDNYYMVVAYPKLEILNYIKQLPETMKMKVELLTDTECCYCKCNFKHYNQESFNNLYNAYITEHQCYKSLPNYSWEKESSLLRAEEKVIIDYNLFNAIGIKNFKFQGRGENIDSLLRGTCIKLFNNNVENYIRTVQSIYDSSI